MTLPLPALYHWSPQDRRRSIIRHGLKPRTPTLVEVFAQEPTGPRNMLTSQGVDTVQAVCLGTSPSHAWSLCGAIWAQRAETWDLWQVELAEADTTHVLGCDGYRLGEIRIANRIPKCRVWHVGTRTVGKQRWSHA